MRKLKAYIDCTLFQITIVITLNDPESEKSENPETIKKSLDDIVHKLDQDANASKSWSASITSNKEEWERLKKQIHERQKALKQLVTDKKAGIIGVDEFDEKYKKLQDELTELEFAVYNLRLGTKVQ
jgi:chromosome segregation ATPase